MPLKFLLDVNASGAVADWLKKNGHDIEQVGHINPRMTDEEILRWAQSENRIVITTDKDFEEMISLQGRDHSGILRLENLPRVKRLKLLSDVLEKHVRDLETGAIVIAKTAKYRIRR